MENRKLNLHAPLMSARRYASPLNSSENLKGDVIEKHLNMKQQFYKTNIPSRRSEMVMKQVGIPFNWEKSPGRPKDDFGSQEEFAPRFPLSRSLDVLRRHRSGEVSRHAPAARMYRFTSGERFNDHKIHRPQTETFSFSDHAMIVQKLNESLKCAEGNGSESGDSYSDALDVLSSSESGALCNNVDHVMPSGVDTQTRDIMMKRFLQEAKAAVVETQDPVRKSVSRVIAPFPNALNSLQHDNQCADDGESEDEIPTKKSGRLAWGFLPRFCVKNNFCLMNPIPGLKSKKRATSVPKAVEAPRVTRNSASGPLQQSGSPVPVVQKKKYHSGLLPRDLPLIDNTLNSHPVQFMNSHDSYKSGLAQLRRYRSGSLSPCRNESHGDGLRPIDHEVVGLKGNEIASSRKLFNALHDVSRSNMNGRVSVPAREAVEKTVYIDVSSYKKAGPFDISGKNSKIDKGRGRIEDVKPRYKPISTVTKDRELVQDVGKEAVKKPLRLAPPLPDSPSESWLWMASTRKSLNPRLPPQRQIQKLRSLDSQCEMNASKEQNMKTPF